MNDENMDMFICMYTAQQHESDDTCNDRDSDQCNIKIENVNRLTQANFSLQNFIYKCVNYSKKNPTLKPKMQKKMRLFKYIV